MSLIKYRLDKSGIATLTLNRDEKRNAVNQQMAEQILRRLGQAVKEGARVVILRANAGAEIWCAGHDLAELDKDALQENPTLEVIDTIQAMPLPIIAMVEGAVYAGGLLMLLSADLVIAAPNAHASITSNKLGIPLATQLYAYWLRVMGIHKTKELLFTAEPISPRDAYVAGLYNHVVSQGQLEPFTITLAEKIIQCAPDGLANTKRHLNLLAKQSALGEAACEELKERNREILASPATQERIQALLSAVRKET